MTALCAVRRALFAASKGVVMPLVKFSLRKGTSPEFRRAMSDAVHQALVAKANVPADDQFHIVQELDADSIIAHPSYGGVSRSPALIIIEITLNAGRSVDMKKDIYAEIARRLGAELDVRPDDILVSLVEVTKENWSFGRGKATYA
jgi:4-oxalocrotonate tautomerase